MGVGERVRDHRARRDHGAGRQRAVHAQLVVQRPEVVVLHDDAGPAVRRELRVQDGDDVRVGPTQPDRDLELALEARPGRHPIGFTGEDLHRHRPVQPLLPGPVDHAVAAGGDEHEVPVAGQVEVGALAGRVARLR